jgi:hypothetical protein
MPSATKHMNIKTFLTTTCITLCGCLSAQARAPEPSFPQKVELTSAEERLIKLGEYRYVYRMFFKLYDAALYASPNAKTADVLNAQTNYRLQFRYLREIDKSIILESSGKMLEKNLLPDELNLIAERVKRLNSAYQTVKEGDRSSLTYRTGVGTTLRINGESAMTIEGADFARLYFKIWLGEQPISGSLRKALLGGA